MERKHLEQLLALVRSVACYDRKGGGGEGEGVMAELERAIGDELAPPPAGAAVAAGGGRAATPCLPHLKEFAPEGAPAVLRLTVQLAEDLRICRFSVDAIEGADGACAAIAAHRLGLMAARQSNHKGAQQA